MRGPHYTDIRKVLSKQHINECIKIVSDLKTETIREPLIKFLNNDYYNQEALADYRDFTSKLDTVRGTSLEVVNPQLYEWTFTDF